MTRKKLVIGFLLLLMAAGAFLVFQHLSTFSASKGNDNESNHVLGFRITWKGYSGRGEAISRITERYNQEGNPGRDVVVENGDEDIQTIESLLKSNMQTVFVLPYRFVKYFGMKGALADLTEHFADANALFFPQVWELGTYKSAVYGMPWLGHSMALIYNKALLNRAGVEPASITSLDALVEAMEKVGAATDARGIGLVGADSNDVSWMVNQFVYGFGASLVSEDGRRVTVNSNKARDALVFYRDVLGPHAQPTWREDTGIEVMGRFLNQEVAFEIQGIWGVTDIQKNGSPFEVGVIALKDIGLCAEVGPMMLAIPSGMDEKTKEEAFRLMRYLISYDAQEQIMKGEYSPEHDMHYPFRTPIRMDMADSAIFHSHPEYLAFIRGFESPSIDVPVPKWQEVKDQIYEPGLSRVMRGELSVDEFLTTLEDEGNKMLSEPQD